LYFKFLFDFNQGIVKESSTTIFKTRNKKVLARLQKDVNKMIYNFVNDNREVFETISVNSNNVTKILTKYINGELIINQEFNYNTNVNTIEIFDLDQLGYGISMYIKYLFNG